MNVNKELAVLAARVPKALIKQLDKSARAAGRTRSAEVLMRLRESLQGAPAAQVAHPERLTNGG